MIKKILILLVLVNLAFADFIKDDVKEIVIDTTTALMWQDDNDAKTITKNWTDAIDYCENLTLGDYSDWHLPNFNELYMLADRSIYNPSLNSAFTNVVSSYYCSSTTYASNTSYAWIVYFNNGGYVYDDKTGTFYVRCVRSAE
ncbi:MAG: DUF1566 domain-containing protein [Arcobacteraceae bacterium]|nr:DUF1566 domain-containing protein [Arcobacteraceae bacterium]